MLQNRKGQQIMFEYMETLSAGEQEALKKTIQDLFRQTCILQVKYDPATLEARDNPRYGVCERHRDFISDYLSVLDCTLLHDAQEHFFRIEGDGVPVERLSLVATKIVILLKLIYRDRMMGDGLRATTTSLMEIREYGRNTNLITKKLTGTEWTDALSLLKTHQIIELPGAIGNMEDDTPIYIYHTINIFCPAAEIGEVVAKYRAEEEESETGEEDLHENVSE